MDDIKNWIENGEDFEEGVALLSRRCRNRFMIDIIVRKRNEKKLRYELGKFLPKTDALDDVETAIATKPHQRLRVVHEHGDAVRFEDLPLVIREVYDEVCDLWREMRSVHETMKQATTDGARAELRGQLLDLESKHRTGWAILDKWSENRIIPEGLEPTPDPDANPGPAPTVAPDAMAVNAAKANVTRTLKKLDGEKDPGRCAELIERLKPWVVTIQAAGGNFKGNAEKLSELGLIPPIQA